MNRKIQKYEIEHHEYNPKYLKRVYEFELPDDASILTFADQENKLVIWCAVTPDRPLRKTTLVIVPTGEDIPDGPLNYLRSAPWRNNTEMWHLYELIGDDSNFLNKGFFYRDIK